MKITDITIDPLTTGRALVRVFTDEGITGLAESGRAPLVFKAYLEDTIKPITETVQQLSQQVNALQIQAPTESVAPANSEDPDEDFLTRFSVNPENAVSGLIAKQIREGVAPMIGSLVQSVWSYSSQSMGVRRVG